MTVQYPFLHSVVLGGIGTCCYKKRAKLAQAFEKSVNEMNQQHISLLLPWAGVYPMVQYREVALDGGSLPEHIQVGGCSVYHLVQLDCS